MHLVSSGEARMQDLRFGVKAKGTGIATIDKRVFLNIVETCPAGDAESFANPVTGPMNQKSREHQDITTLHLDGYKILLVH